MGKLVIFIAIFLIIIIVSIFKSYLNMFKEERELKDYQEFERLDYDRYVVKEKSV